MRTPFFQMTRAYLVGRISGKGWMLPFVLALKNTESGVLIDAVMMDESVRQHPVQLHALVFPRRPARTSAEAVVFLKTILPRKPVSELYTVLGRAKQGKTERYRELFRHLQQSTDRFVHAPGRARPGDGLLHAALVRRGVQDHPRPFRRIRRTSCARKCWRSTSWCSSTTAPAGWSMRRSSSACSSRRRASRDELLEELQTEAAEHRALRGRRAGHRPRVHRAAHDAAQPLHPQRLARGRRARRARLRAVHPRPGRTPTSSRATCC